MANLQYDISASYVGDGFESTSVFQFYYNDCGNIDNLVESVGGSNTFTAAQIESGVTLVVPDTGQYLYLLPLSEECPLGCNYLYSASLSGYIAPSPTPTQTPTVTPTPTKTPLVTPTPTPSNSGPALPDTYGTHTFSHSSGTITITWPASTSYYTKYGFASSLANYLTGTTVSVTTNPATPNDEDLAFSFQVFEEDLTTVAYDVNENISSTVWFYGNPSSNTVYLTVTNVNVGDPQGIGSSYGDYLLGYLEG